MKKIIIAIAALSAALSFTSCNKEEVVTGGSDIQPEAPVTVYATTGAMTKTSLSGNDTHGYQVLWSADDKIKFVSKSNPAKTAVFTLTDGVGKTSGTFELKGGETHPEDGDYIVYYPATYDGTNWPASQTYVEGNISESPMKAEAEVSEGKISDLNFKNAGGILRLRITVAENADVKINKISFYAKELSSPVVLNCSSSVSLSSEAKTFHIAMPSNGNEQASYSIVSIYLTDTNGKVCCKSPKAPTLDIARSQITNASFSVNSTDFYSYTTGSKVKVSGHEGVVVDLNHDNAADVIVATMNVGATAVNGEDCLGDKMEYDAACAAWSGWRLPDVDELTTLCDVSYPTWGDTDEGEGKGALLWDFDNNLEFDLYLPLNDYEETEVGTYPYGKYWTGTPGKNDTEKCFYFAPELDFESGYDHNYVPVAYGDRSEEVPYKAEAAKTSEFLVRLFHDLP